MKTHPVLRLLIIILIAASSQVVYSQQPGFVPNKPPFDFPALPYGYDALEPYIDKMTMEIHYAKHHRAYFDNFIKAIAGTEYASMSIEDIFKSISKAPVSVRNNGGGYYNHILFWENMAPQGQGGTLSPELQQAIQASFGSYVAFEKQFADAAKGRFGSGWAWLIVDGQGKLAITSTANQDNPLMDIADPQGTPLLTLDVWEHAYYLKYQNRRADYIDAFWNVVNWNTVNRRFTEATR